MTRPEQVLVNVTDLEAFKDFLNATCSAVLPHSWVARLVAAIPESEWEPTNDVVKRTDRALDSCEENLLTAADLLKAMHREGLL